MVAELKPRSLTEFPTEAISAWRFFLTGKEPRLVPYWLVKSKFSFSWFVRGVRSRLSVIILLLCV